MSYKALIKTAFLPDFDEGFKRFIENNVEPEYENEDYSQYKVEDIRFKVDESDKIFLTKDMAILIQLETEEIEYVEF